MQMFCLEQPTSRTKAETTSSLQTGERTGDLQLLTWCYRQINLENVFILSNY